MLKIPIRQSPFIKLTREEIVYPESDGQPMADNTLQFSWIMTIQGGLDLMYKDNPAVFVAGDLLWYPVEGNPKIRVAPDTLVAFGRPKGHRGSYQQWHEENIPPQVVFEVLSPGNTTSEMIRKWRFYDRYAVEEYYLYDPYDNVISGWTRIDGELQEIDSERFVTESGWTSPLLEITFQKTSETLTITRPDGEQFATYVELGSQLEQERVRAEQAYSRAEQERVRAEKLAAQLRALGVEPLD